MRHLILFLFTSLILFACNTEEPQNLPTVITKVASDVKFNVATLNGEVTDEGFSATTDRGFVFSEKNTNPSNNFGKIRLGYGKGVYSIFIDALEGNTKYYYTAYATNTKGTAYGEVQSFTTADYNTAILRGNLVDTGGATITESGVCFGLNPNPTISDNKVIANKPSIGSYIGPYSVNAVNLKVNSKYYYRAYAINSKGIVYGNEQSFSTLNNTTIVVEVKSKTGRIWMDRNLGATRVATSSKDVESYGDLYQWGRKLDGHQNRTSGVTNTLANSDQPSTTNFIISPGSPQDWRSPQNANLWQGVNGINNPCPSGYRIPTETEWWEERNSWSTPNAAGAFASPLKLTLGGFRYGAGSLPLVSVAEVGFYWSSTVGKFENNPNMGSRSLRINPENAFIFTVIRAEGHSCRCIKD
jgi:uncharacterized protein (TIGR02145 family)